MRVICIRALLRDPNNKDKWSVLKGLHEDTFYYLYDGYDIQDEYIEIRDRNVPDTLFYPQRYAKGKTNATFVVDICAIVGQNGAGKSTLVDIYIRVMNNLAAYIFGEKFIFPKAEHLHFITGVFAEVYLEIESSIYCIRCHDKAIEVLKFVQDDNERKRYRKTDGSVLSDVVDTKNALHPHPQHLDLLSKLCYSTILNYSLHSYNSLSYNDENTKPRKEIAIRKAGYKDGLYRPDYLFDENGKKRKLNKALLDEHFPEGYSWLSGLFHKNDGFQTPLVISPKRDYGMIDINNENGLSKERLLSLLFVENNAEEHHGKKFFPFSEINSKLRIEGFTLSANAKTIDDYKEMPQKHPDLPHYTEGEYADVRDFIRKAYDDTFHIESADRYHKEEAINYLIAKTIKIFMTYPRYEMTRAFLANKRIRLRDADKEGLRKDLNMLWQDHTHITTKMWRTLNYLRFDHIDKRTSFQTEDLAEKIDHIIERYQKKDTAISMPFPPVETDELLPPPLFDVDFHVYEISDSKKRHMIPFSTLSSGEKQITYILCSLFYYMLCLDSASRFRHTNDSSNQQIEYKHINIIFDEIELYFHPEMQRNFISTLLHGLQQLPFQTIKSLHFLIVTHSPFVLSDLPMQNILFLQKGGEIANSIDKASFGANIHTMLLNSFFLEGGAMGQFAKETIVELIDQTNAVRLQQELRRFDGNAEKMIEANYSVFNSLPATYQEKLRNGSDADLAVDWNFAAKMAEVIQEPIIRRRLKEILERRRNDVDTES